MSSWVPAAIAVAVAICLLLLEIFLNRRRARAKSKREAATKFRSAFAEAITHLHNTDKDAYLLITQARANHDAAITDFRRLVHPKQIKHFDAAEQKFHRCRSEVRPRAVKILAAIDSETPVDHSDTVRLKESLNELLAFADRT